MLTNTFDVAIVGAGIAGLSAARTLAEAGRSFVLLEAGPMPGGRARTSRPAALGGAAMDEGASWLHAADRNPLIPLLRAQGQRVIDTDERPLRVRIGDRWADPADLAAYDAAQDRWRQTALAYLGEPDRSLAAAGDALAADPWLPAIEAWEGAIIAAADADILSLADWHRNELDGGNRTVPGGLGDALLRLLAPPPGTLRLNTPVSRIDTTAGAVRLATPAGEVCAAAAIVTVSTGVLASAAIGFEPALPAAARAAIHALPMGLLTKIALHLPRPAGALAPGTVLFRRPAHRGDPMTTVIAWPEGTDHVLGFVGGRAAWVLSGQPEPHSRAFLRDELISLLGPAAVPGLAEGPGVPEGMVTRWGEDPLFRGAYAYAGPGGAAARGALTRPLADGRLWFAGEAWRCDGLAGTVAGAFLSGRDAAAGIGEGLVL